ncbi:unnamed protein product, partial [Prunus brigantina]
MLKSHMTYLRYWDPMTNTKIQEVKVLVSMRLVLTMSLLYRVAGLQRKLDSVLNMVPKVPQVEVCGICNVQGHSTHMCPAGNDYPAFIHEQAHMMNSYNQRPRNDPFSNTYNPGWRNHPN